MKIPENFSAPTKATSGRPAYFTGAILSEVRTIAKLLVSVPGPIIFIGLIWIPRGNAGYIRRQSKII